MEPSANSDPRSDEALVDAANAGDPAAFEALYYRYRDWVVRMAYRFTLNRDDALDVLQETFAYLLKKFPGLRLTAKMTTFLYPVVRNLSIAIRRKQRRYVSDDTIAEKTAAPPAGGAAASRAELAAVLAVLPEKQREVLLLRFVDGLSLKEIAETLRIPEGTVKSRLHHALQTLRNDDRTRRYFGT